MSFPSPHQCLLFAILLMLGGCGSSLEEKEVGAPPRAADRATVEPKPAATDQPVAEAESLIRDDGKTLWVSPTDGVPIDLSIIPDRSDLILYLRPSELLATDEGRRVWQALGPAGDSAQRAIEAASDKRLAETESLVLGVAAGDSYESLSTTLAIESKPSDRLPLLQREIEQLVETSDSQRHATLIFSPRFLLGDGGSMLRGAWEPLREMLLAQVRDDWAAAALSLHLDDQRRLYWELRLLKTAADPETRTAIALRRQIEGWKDDLKPVVAAGTWSLYSREVIERSPAMFEVLGKYARRGVDGRQAVVNGYAPPDAAHQMLLAIERIVAERAAPPGTSFASNESTTPDELPIAQRLRQPVTISFPRESLETAVAILSDTLATPITIVGRDLQLEGITRNQMLALNVTQMPADEALVEVLRLANPDREATGPADPKQKLVYVVREDSIAITTRSAAERRGESLPAAFTP